MGSITAKNSLIACAAAHEVQTGKIVSNGSLIGGFFLSLSTDWGIHVLAKRQSEKRFNLTVELNSFSATLKIIKHFLTPKNHLSSLTKLPPTLNILKIV